jgi:hypothetical protein
MHTHLGVVALCGSCTVTHEHVSDDAHEEIVEREDLCLSRIVPDERRQAVHACSNCVCARVCVCVYVTCVCFNACANNITQNVGMHTVFCSSGLLSACACACLDDDTSNLCAHMMRKHATGKCLYESP